jgi:hypothetical protein
MEPSQEHAIAEDGRRLYDKLSAGRMTMQTFIGSGGHRAPTGSVYRLLQCQSNAICDLTRHVEHPHRKQLVHFRCWTRFSPPIKK